MNFHQYDGPYLQYIQMIDSDLNILGFKRFGLGSWVYINWEMSYKRILLKLSGESLSGDKNFGISALKISHYVQGIKRLLSEKIELAIVIGGGNIFRGIDAKEQGLDNTQGDYMGMLAIPFSNLIY